MSEPTDLRRRLLMADLRHAQVDIPDLVVEWKPRKRRTIPLPENLPREVHRLVWWLEDIGCVRSPFISHRDCLDIDGIKQEAMCGRCRALRPYREALCEYDKGDIR